jgi:hypothetical protein
LIVMHKKVEESGITAGRALCRDRPQSSQRSTSIVTSLEKGE